jgi:hypothetical protein
LCATGSNKKTLFYKTVCADAGYRKTAESFATDTLDRALVISRGVKN